jgi:hypothetical protein
MNVVGGYAVTDRMLEMFKAKPGAPAPKPGTDYLSATAEVAQDPAGPPPGDSSSGGAS